MKECVIWTVNIDSRKKRCEGRKIALRFAVPNVKLFELVKACEQLGIPCRAEEKSYPKCWWEEGGRVVIPKRGSKIKTMVEIAKKIKEIREKEKPKKKRKK